MEGQIVRRLPHDVPLFPVLDAIAAFIEEHGPLTRPQEGITLALVDRATAGQDLPARLLDTLTRVEASTEPEPTPAPTSASTQEGEPHPDWPSSTPVPAADTLEGQIVLRLAHDVPLLPVLEAIAAFSEEHGPLTAFQKGVTLTLVSRATAGQDLPAQILKAFADIAAQTEQEPAPGLPCSDCEASRGELWVADTQGDGVASRNDCRDAARTGRRGLAEGTPVRRIATGTGRCSGWSYVTSGAWSGWVRDRYLSESAPPTPISLNPHWWPVLPLEFCTLPLDPEYAARFSAAQFRDAVEHAAETWNDALREASHGQALTGVAIRYTGDCPPVEFFTGRDGNRVNEIFVEPFDPEYAEHVGWAILWPFLVAPEADIRISPSLSASCELRGVLMHEFGRALGLSEGGGRADLMYPGYERCISGPSAGEVATLLDHWARTDLGRYDDLPVSGKVLGDPDAPVRIVVLEDFGCGVCRTFNHDIKPTLEEEYIADGVVSLEFWHVAILSRYSLWSAAASECAADQGLFWPYHDLLFRFGVFQDPRTLARALNARLDGPGLDLEEFDTCFDTATHGQAVIDSTEEARDLMEGLGAGRRLASPTFIVNGELWSVGLWPLQAFRDKIDSVHAAERDGE